MDSHFEQRFSASPGGAASPRSDPSAGHNGTVRDPQPNDAVVESVAAYSEHADEYEATHRPKMANQVERFARSLRTPSLILDAGCGPGRDLARFTSLGHVSRGIDLNPDFVAMATAHAQTSCADLRGIGSMFPAGHFDGVWSSASLVHLKEADAKDVLRQFFVLLRPGGKLYACVNTVGRTGWVREPDGRRWYCVWEHRAFAQAVAAVGFGVDQVVQGPFVEVWATRGG